MAWGCRVSDRPKRESMKRVEDFILAHKVIAAAIALVLLGAAGATALSQFVTESDFKAHREAESQLWIQIQELRETSIATGRDIDALRSRIMATQSNLTMLLQHVLAVPPSRTETE